jgi:hypothetical protein
MTTTQAGPSPTRTPPAGGASLLRDRRFATRFLGRRGTWIWLAATLLPGLAAWLWARHALRGFAGDERTWFLWSGNVLLILFVATLAFVVRKWSILLPVVRDWGRAPPAASDAAWAEVQVLNAKIRQGAFGSDAEIAAAADAVLRRFQVDRSQRAEIRTMALAGRDVKYVQLRKREPFGRLEPWLEMHMGVGVAACVGVWFHADGRIVHPVGWTLLAGSAVLLVTGVVLAVLYRVLPAKLARVGGEIPFEEAGVARETYERCLAGVVSTMSPELQAELRELLEPSSGPEDLRRRGDAVLARATAKAPDQAEVVRDALVLAGTRDHLLWSTAAARKIDRAMKLWRWIHVPVSVFVFFVIALHVLLVLWY